MFYITCSTHPGQVFRSEIIFRHSTKQPAYQKRLSKGFFYANKKIAYLDFQAYKNRLIYCIYLYTHVYVYVHMYHMDIH